MMSDVKNRNKNNECSKKGEEKLLLLQKELKFLLAEFVKKCNQHNLKYFLFYGTLLGSIRHKGFIPWDDDIDLLMPREDIEKFVELFRDYYSDNAYLDGYNCKHYNSFAPNVRINSNKVYLRQNMNGKETFLPAFLSIWIIDGLPHNLSERKRHIKKVFRKYKLLRLSRSSRQGTLKLKNRPVSEKIAIFLTKLLPIGKLINPRKAAKKFNQLLQKYPINTSESCFIGWNEKGNRIFKTNWFADNLISSFDNIVCKIPVGYKEILELEYGNYLELPPENKRAPSHNIDIKIV